MQGCDIVLRRQLNAVGEVTMRVLRCPPRDGQNIGEWAKQSACRETALRTDVPVVRAFEGWIVDADTVRAETQETRADGQVDEDLRLMRRVLAIGFDAWSALREHARAKNLLQPHDEAALRAACGQSGRPPNELQARRLVALLERARETGWHTTEAAAE